MKDLDIVIAVIGHFDKKSSDYQGRTVFSVTADNIGVRKTTYYFCIMYLMNISIYSLENLPVTTILKLSFLIILGK